MAMIDMQKHGLEIQVITLAHYLALEINTDGRVKGSRRINTVKVAQGFGFTGRTKRAALVWLVEVVGYVPVGTVLRAYETAKERDAH